MRLTRYFFLLSFFLLAAPTYSQMISGHTAGQFQVNESGAATYTVPITVPPGTSGLEPGLSLAYSSQGRNSLLGMGWSLSGLSVISRCPATYAQDDFVDGVDFDEDDRFCLDGERLMVVGGVYGADASEYRTEQDTFRRAVSNGESGEGPSSFTIWTKSGLILEYGGTDDSRIEAQGRSDVLFWAVNRIADTKGNYLAVSYIEDNANGEYRPDRIDYTANDEEGLAPYASVQFVYETRPDVTSRYVGGALLKTTQRLAAVQTYEGEHLYREYLLTYGTAPINGYSRLESLTECGSEGSCFAPTSLTWQESPSSFEHVNHSGFDIYTENAGLNWLSDFNGDGLTDFASYVAGSSGTQVRVSYATDSGFTAVTSSNFDIYTSNAGFNWLGDFNGDGMTDLASYVAGTGGTQVQVNYSTGTGFAAAVYGGFDIYTSDNPGRNWLGDFNGDGLTDIASYVSGSGGTQLRVHYSTGSGFTVAIYGGFQIYTASSSRNWLGDFNGDGLTDLASYVAGSGGTQIRVHYSTGTGFTAITHTGFDVYTDNNGLNWLGDFNGDGLTDFVSYVGGSGGSQIRVHYFTGSGVTASIYGGLDIYTANDGRNWQGDFNGDGLADIASYVAGAGGTEIRVHYSTGSGFTATVYGGFEIYTASSARNWLGDFDGDGLTDIASYVAGSGGTGVRTQESRNPRQLIDSITTGHGMETLLDFLPLTATGLYTKDEAAEYPEQDFQGPMYVVSAYSTNDGIGNTSSFTYNYGGARVNLHGRGFRGFDRTTVTEELTGLETTIFYERDYRCISSKILRTEQRQPDGTLISEVDNTIEIQDHGFGVHFSYVGESVAKRYELDGGLVSTVTTQTDYDDYGNVTTLSVDYGEGFTEAIVNTYDDDLDTWFLGRLTRTEVTKAAPGQPDKTRTSAFTYDPDSGMLTSEIIEPDDPLLRLEKVYVHDPFGNVSTSTTSGPGITARSHTTSYETLGRFVEQSTNSLAHSETKTYVLGNLASLTGPNGLTTEWVYDGFGRQISELRANGTETVTTYERCDASCPERGVHFARSETTGAPTTVTYFDLLDREIRKETQGFDGSPIYADTEYNMRGLVARKSEPYFAGDSPLWTTYVHDLLGRVTVETAPGSRTTTTTYAGRTTTVTNPLGQQNTRTVDARGQLIESVDNHGNSVTYAYDAVGNMVEITDPEGNVTSLTFDIRGNKTSITDPDTGTTLFTYNSLGELTSQLDANGNTATMTYDTLGRLVTRAEPEGVSTWTYDTHTNGIGKLARVSRSGFTQETFYDSLGRPDEALVTIGGDSFSITTGYDLFGRPETLHYPTGFGVRTLYNAQGYAQELRRTSNDDTLWQAGTINARGQLEEITFGNGLVGTRTYDPQTGQVEAIQAGSVQDLAFSYDLIGNVTSRSDQLRGLSESFGYDGLNRLISSQVAGHAASQFTYDSLGNITSKTGIGTYTYGENTAGPHAVTTTQGSHETRYQYDASGNLVLKETVVPEGLIFADGFESGDTTAWQPGGGGSMAVSTTVAYTSFNKPRTITQGGTTLTFDYGPEYGRYRQEVTTDQGTTTKLYIGGLLEREITGGLTKNIHFVRAGGETVAVYTAEDTGSATFQTTRYLHRDHLGSVQTITDEAGDVVEVLSYDAWGLRRNAETWASAATLIIPTLDRGFTGHEHLDEVGLIHMNGRVYDPAIGRFLSADPFVQVPELSQSLNRYTYVLNNPLSFSDPSGFFFKNLFRAVGKALSSISSFVKEHVYSIANLLAAATGNPWVIVGTTFATSFAASVQSGAGFGDSLVSGLTAAAVAGVSIGISDFIGGDSFLEGANEYFRNAGQAIGHGVVQGTSRAALGGKFEHGFLAGALRKFGSFGGNALGGRVGEAIGRILAAGTAEELGGSKFANGAITSSLAYALGQGLQSARGESTSIGEVALGVLDVVGKIWALPNTLVGAVYGSLGHIAGWASYAAGWQTQSPSIEIGNNAVQLLNNPFIFSGAALTLGNIVIYGAGATPEMWGAYGNFGVQLGPHEGGHTYQSQILGPLFGPAYLLVGGFSGPSGNPFEQAAQNYGSGRGSWWPW